MQHLWGRLQRVKGGRVWGGWGGGVGGRGKGKGGGRTHFSGASPSDLAAPRAQGGKGSLFLALLHAAAAPKAPSRASRPTY